uniref:MAPK activated protein kinase 5 n=1 Tax=Propithecus coquereli TaxID=379532 RepID=A0A2K6GBD2_PROCO
MSEESDMDKAIKVRSICFRMVCRNSTWRVGFYLSLPVSLKLASWKSAH